jgi:outer membrane protein assembly factor BamB
MEPMNHSKENGEQISAWAANRKVAAQAHFQHMNSGTVIDGKLYVAHSRFPLALNDNSVEVFLLENGSIRHEATIRMPKDHGSLTWIDKKSDDSWWMCYAVYGKPQNRKTTLVKYCSDKGSFIEQQSWIFPAEVVDKWGVMSCSGGSWGADGKLYVTGHDNAEVVVLEMDSAAALRYVRSEPVAGIAGQAIAWDRSVEKPSLWGIVKNKHVSLTVFPR